MIENQDPRILRIALVDDHQMFTSGMKLLAESLNWPGQLICFHSGIEFLEALDQGQAFDVIVTDLAMKPINGLALVSALRERGIAQPVLFLSASDDALSRLQSEKVGAQGFLHKSDDPQSVFDAILAACNLPPSKPKTQNPRATPPLDDEAELKPVPKLGRQQRRVLELITNGLSNRDIAEALNISENTVKTHAKAIFKELQVSSRTEAAMRARDLALV